MVSENKIYDTKLLPIQAVSKDLGIPKSGVQSLIDNGKLFAVDVDGKPYITAQSVIGLLRQKPPADFGQRDNGYPPLEELSSLLTKEKLVERPEKAGAAMIEYKGSVSTLKDGRFMVQIDKGKKPNGKRDRESKGFRDESEAYNYLEKRLAELNAKQVQPVTAAVPPTLPVPAISQGNYTTLTFEEYAVNLLNEGVGKATTRTIEGYRRGLWPVIKHIGKIPMVEITPQDLKKMFEKMRYEYAKSNMTRSFNTTRLVLQTAYDNNEIPTDPMRKLKCPSSKKPVVKSPFPTYSDEDIKTLFSTSKEYSQELYTMFAVLECTGMRPGEMRALEWNSFNPAEKTIHIKQAITTEYEEIKTIKKAAKSKEILSVTKSEYGVRTMRLSDLAVQALQEWRKKLDRVKNISQRDSAFIFPDRKGNFKSETSCQTTIQRYRKKYGLEDIGVVFYKFRHTMCTRLILDGQPIPVIQRIMGDNTTDVIMKIYTHVNEEMALKATEGFYDNLNKRHADIAS